MSELNNGAMRREGKNLNTFLLSVLLLVTVPLLSWNVLQSHNNALDLAKITAEMMPRQETESRLAQVEAEIANINVRLAEIGYQNERARNKGNWEPK